MGIRSNKTNFGLSFGHFWEQKCEEERKEEKKKEKVWNLCMETSFVWNSMICMDSYGIGIDF